jgi:S1-C subfamily serine protease
MASEKVTVSLDEIDKTVVETNAPPAALKQLPPAIPLWSRIALSALALVLPLLCVVTVILRVAFRSQPPRDRNAMTSFLSTLLVISGLITTVAFALVLFLGPIPVPGLVNAGLPELDERAEFPSLTANAVLSSADVSRELKSLVIVVSPAVTQWGKQETPGSSFGAGMLLEADKDGYLFATANHVVGKIAAKEGGTPQHVMVTTAAGVWSTADVIAAAVPLDLALLWVPRHSGKGEFVQPIAKPTDGEPVFVIGHPEGLKYTLSTGLISGLRDQIIQISAAVSPGNSGGPVYDDHGSLLGIVSSKFDRNVDANGENLGFAAQAVMLRDPSKWAFYGKGRERLADYLKALQSAPVVAVPNL